MKNNAYADPRPIVAISFPFEDNSWLGGSYSISHLLNAYLSLPNPKLRLVLAAPLALPKYVADELPPIPIWRTSLMSRGSAAHILRRLVRKFLSRDILFERWLRKRHVDVLSHAQALGKEATIPVIGYITDLGVHYHSDLYSAERADGVKRYIYSYVNSVSTVLLLSDAVERDFVELYQNTKGFREVVHIVPAVNKRNSDAELEVVARYGLPERYFYLPNKFWVHKNHGVVIEALGLLRLRGQRVRVVCSGMTNDERQPHYFSELMKRAEELGVEQDLQIIGIVPGPDVVALMGGSVAVLNPSKFEGWGLSVAEAREMGKCVILSDIPVFREHEPARVEFFLPDDASALADILIKAHDSFDQAVDDAAQEAAQKVHLAHKQSYARAYERVVLATIERNQRAQ